MLQLELALYLFTRLSARIATARREGDRGDVAEKIVIVGIFVVLAIAAGALIAKAVTSDATNISKTITGAAH